MKLKAQRIRPLDYFGSNAQSLEESQNQGVLRILNQAAFDQGNNGGCQTAAMMSAIENKFQFRASYEEMRELYFKMDKFWDGRGEKVSRVLRYMQAVGHQFDTRSRIFAKDYTSIPTKECTFEVLNEASKKFDLVEVGIAGRSGFFSPISGKLYEGIKLPAYAGHAMRVLPENHRRELAFVNSWTTDWGYGGIGLATPENFHLLNFWEVKCCNFETKK